MPCLQSDSVHRAVVPFRFGLLFLVLATTTAACSPEAPPPARLDYAELANQWETWRTSRDSLFRSASSPLLPSDQAAFDGLPYFAYDSSAAVSAALVPAMVADTARFPTSTGELRPMPVAGQLVFDVDGTERRLMAYQAVGPDGRPTVGLFVPFRDATSGRATYGGGRYLDLDGRPDAEGRIVVDFNKAYHPYCVYSEAYSCPLPPAENTLAVAMEAGERLGSAPSE
ncbi:MAG: DUF1684 domain-containing protein [Rubricoccaceae bacterium]